MDTITKGFIDLELLKPYEIENLQKFIKNNGLIYNSETQKYDCNHNLEIYKDVKWDICVKGGNYLGLKFGVIKGKFMIGTDWLYSLYGCPTRVEGNVYVCEPQISNFKGAPEYVEGNFDADACGVISLKGLPKYVGGNLLIDHCNHLNKCDLDPEMIVKGNIISFYGCSRAGHSREFYEELRKNLPKTFDGTVVLPNGHECSAEYARNGFFNDPSWC